MPIATGTPAAAVENQDHRMRKRRWTQMTLDPVGGASSAGSAEATLTSISAATINDRSMAASSKRQIRIDCNGLAQTFSPQYQIIAHRTRLMAFCASDDRAPPGEPRHSRCADGKCDNGQEFTEHKARIDRTQ